MKTEKSSFSFKYALLALLMFFSVGVMAQTTVTGTVSTTSSISHAVLISMAFPQCFGTTIATIPMVRCSTISITTTEPAISPRSSR